MQSPQSTPQLKLHTQTGANKHEIVGESCI
jgi:hypothetical protein